MIKLNIPLVAEEFGPKYSLMKGNLLMSEKMPHEIKTTVEDRRVLVVNTSKRWSIAPVLERKSGSTSLYEQERTIVHDIGEKPFSFDNPPFELAVRSKNVQNWDYDISGFAAIPKKPDYSEESLERTFIPYGCTLLHIAQFPKCVK